MLHHWNLMKRRMSGLSIAVGVLLMSSLACNFGSQPAELAVPTVAQSLPTLIVATVIPTEITAPLLTSTSAPNSPAPTTVPNTLSPAATNCPDQPGKTDALFSGSTTSTTVTNNLSRRAADTWTMHGLAGQKLSLQLVSSTGKAYLIVSGANRTLLLTSDLLASSFSGSLPSTQDYYVIVNSNSLVCSNYTLTASLTG